MIKKILLILTMCVLTGQVYAQDNVLTMTQQGNDVIIDVLQAGYDNSILVDLGLTSGDSGNEFEVKQDGNDNNLFLSIGGNSNSLWVLQQGQNNEIGWTNSWGSGKAWGGDLDGNSNSLTFRQNCTRGSSCAKSDIGFHIQGDSNTVKYGQGVYMASSDNTAFIYDSDEGGGHTTTLDIHGDNNTLTGYQRNGNIDSYSGHTATLYLYGDNQTLHAVQEADGAKTLNYTSNVDGTIGNIRQAHNGGHTATVVLNGNYPTNINLLQNSSTAQTYTLFQNCQTVGGCSISITQE